MTSSSVMNRGSICSIMTVGFMCIDTTAKDMPTVVLWKVTDLVAAASWSGEPSITIFDRGC